MEGEWNGLSLYVAGFRGRGFDGGLDSGSGSAAMAYLLSLPSLGSVSLELQMRAARTLIPVWYPLYLITL